MAKTKVAINGFGRIGRLTFKVLMERSDVEVVAINDLSDTRTLRHLLQYDSTHGKFEDQVTYDENHLIVGNKSISISNEKDPAQLPWKQHDVDVVLEATGLFLKSEDAQKHIDAGAKKVVLSAPPKSSDIDSFVKGVNDDVLTKDVNIISNASCTTNCFTPMVKLLDDLAGIKEGFMSTIHAYTADQNLQDGPHKDLRRSRAAAQNIIPTSTGAAKATTQVLPHLKGKISAVAYRVPVITGSITDFSCTLEKDVSADEVNEAFQKAANGSMKGVLEYCGDPIVSSDIIGNSHSCIFDSGLTDKVQNTVKVVGWYDNEAGYSNRTADLIEAIGKLI